MLVKIFLSLFALILLVGELNCAVVQNKTMSEAAPSKKPIALESTSNDSSTNSTKVQQIKVIGFSFKKVFLLIPKLANKTNQNNKTEVSAIKPTKPVPINGSIHQATPKTAEPSSNENKGNKTEVSAMRSSGPVRTTSKIPTIAPIGTEPASNGSVPLPTPAKPIIVTASFLQMTKPKLATSKPSIHQTFNLNIHQK